mmetsp:Transcript_14658/g.41211  ORF Transcript_14658/g.41211 Transcript_14658/m.41211 type:complete len:538 (+) Transcript_14658:121-1734(+)
MFASVFRAARQVATASRAFATGPAVSSTGPVSDEMLKKLSSLSTQALIDGLWIKGWPTSHIAGARPLASGMKCAGRAVTVQFVGQRPDIAADKPGGESSPEYEAFEQAGPNEVMVLASVGPWESVGGDIKFLRLKQLNVGGLVTDGSVRDTDVLLEYGFPVYSYSTTPRQGPHAHQPWACNVVVNVGGVVVRPGDAIIGDQDGVVVVPAAVAQEVYDIAHSREVVEDIVKEELVKNPGPPGKFYPFITGKIKPESPLGKLLTSKGVKFYSSSTSGRSSTAAAASPSAPSPFGFGSSPRSQGSPRPFGTRAYSSATAKRSVEDMEATIKWFGDYKATAVLRTNTAEAAPKAMNAAIDAGFKIAEFTLTTPGCLDCVSDFRKSRPDVLVGCGTVMNAGQAEQALEAGAQFLVSPCLIPEVVTYAAERNVVIVPGCATPSELYQAYLLGAQIQKVFPGVAGGPAWIKAVGAALPMLRINPTSGTDLSNAAELVRAGVHSMGFVAPLFDPTDISKGDWDAVHKKALALVAETNKGIESLKK